MSTQDGLAPSCRLRSDANVPIYEESIKTELNPETEMSVFFNKFARAPPRHHDDDKWQMSKALR